MNPNDNIMDYLGDTWLDEVKQASALAIQINPSIQLEGNMARLKAGIGGNSVEINPGEQRYGYHVKLTVSIHGDETVIPLTGGYREAFREWLFYIKQYCAPRKAVQYQYSMSSTLIFLYTSAFDGTTGAFKVRTTVMADLDQCGLITEAKVAAVNRELNASGFMVTHINQSVADPESDRWGNTGYLVVQQLEQGLKLREYCKAHADAQKESNSE